MNYIKKDCPYFESNCPGAYDDFADMQPLDCACPKFKAYVDVKNPEIVNEKLKEMNITSTEKMNIMLDMQKIFAAKFHKVDDLTKSEIDHWTDKYLTCIVDEITEAEEFLNIFPKQIKNFDLKEYRKELIDILHFMMDGMIVGGMTYNDLVKYYGEEYNTDLSGVDILDYSIKMEKINVDQISDEDQHLYILNYLLRDCRLVRQCISWKHWKKPSQSINKEELFKSYANMYKHLIQSFIATGMTSDDIYNVYVQKNIENILRQQYGY